MSSTCNTVRPAQLALEDDRMRTTLARLGDRLQAEDGPACTAELLEQWIERA
jgi:UDP:flavonoid glycosyltransferase YjiC (YdhE family)